MRGTTTKAVVAAGLTFQKIEDKNALLYSHPKTCLAGFSSQLTTRTSNIAGVLTTTGANTIQNGDRVALRWESGGVTNVLYNCLVSGKSGNAFTVTAPHTTGFGSNLPALNTTGIIVNKAEVFQKYVLSSGDYTPICVNSNLNHFLLAVFAPVTAHADAMTDLSPDNRLVVQSNGPLIIEGFTEIQSINPDYGSNVIDTLWLYNLSLFNIEAEFAIFDPLS